MLLLQTLLGKWSIRANLRKKGYNSGMKNEAGALKAVLKFTNKRGHLVELFSTECKTKVITLANHGKYEQSNEPIRLQSK